MDLAAERYRIDGTLPTGTGRNPKVVGQIISMAASKAAADGDTAKASALNQIANKANTSALTAVTKQQGMVGAFEKTASANIDLAETELAKLELSGSPMINKAINAYRQGVSGDPQTAKFVNALTAARTEYAKVLSGATGAQGVTDSARGEANDLFSKNMNPDALRAAFATARTEMKNRMAAFEAQKSEIRQSMSPGRAAPGAPAAPQNPAPAAAPSEGATATGPGGSRVIMKNGQWVPLGQ